MAQIAHQLLHWLDLDDDGVWADDAGGWTVTEGNGVVVNATAAPDGGGAADLVNDNSGNNEDYLHPSSFVPPHSSAFTWGIWARADVLNATFNSILSHSNAASSQRFANVSMRDGDGVIRANIWDSSDTVAEVDGPSPAVATWYCIMVSSNSTNDHRLYVNGVRYSSATVLSGAWSSSSMPFCIGSASWSKGLSTLSHDGKLCSLAVWDRQLTNRECDQFYNSGTNLRYVDLAALLNPEVDNLIFVMGT